MQSLIGVFVPALVATILRLGKVKDKYVKVLVSVAVSIIVASAMSVLSGKGFDKEAYSESVVSIFVLSQTVYQVQKSARGLK